MGRQHKKTEAIRLRLEERLSLKQIGRKLDVSTSTLSYWLRDYPLDKREISARQSVSARANNQRVMNSFSSRRQSKFHEMVGQRVLTKDDRARIAEAAVLFRLALRGLDTYGRVFDGQKADWVVTNGCKTARVQVRSLSWHKGRGRPSLSLRCSKGRHGTRRIRNDEFDVLVGYDLYEDIAYVFTSQEVASLTSAISVQEDAAEKWDKLEGLLV